MAHPRPNHGRSSADYTPARMHTKKRAVKQSDGRFHCSYLNYFENKTMTETKDANQFSLTARRLKELRKETFSQREW